MHTSELGDIELPMSAAISLATSTRTYVLGSSNAYSTIASLVKTRTIASGSAVEYAATQSRNARSAAAIRDRGSAE